MNTCPTTLAEIATSVPNVPLLLTKNLNRPVVESPTEYSILSTVGVEGGPVTVRSETKGFVEY